MRMMCRDNANEKIAQTRMDKGFSGIFENLGAVVFE